MFDIRDYYNSGGGSFSGIENEILAIDDHIVSDIENLLVSKVGSLYLCDRYKTRQNMIEIIYPALGYPGPRSVMLTPDKVRFFLSFYPYKTDLERISKIVLRPRYVEAGNVELTALYLKRKKILVLYLSHPLCSDRESGTDGSRFISVSLENLMDDKIIGDSIERSGGRVSSMPSLWNIISVANPEGEGDMDKFLVKREEMDRETYASLNDISYYYYRHGY